MKRNGDTRRETDTETETQRETETRRDSLERGSGHLPSPLPHQESLRPPSTCWPSAQDRPCRPLALPGTGLPASSPAGRRRVTRDAPGGGLPSQQPGQAAWSRCQAGGKASCVEQPPPPPGRASWRTLGAQPASLVPLQPGPPCTLTACPRRSGSPRGVSGILGLFQQGRCGTQGLHLSVLTADSRLGPPTSCPVPSGQGQPPRASPGPL